MFFRIWIIPIASVDIILEKAKIAQRIQRNDFGSNLLVKLINEVVVVANLIPIVIYQHDGPINILTFSFPFVTTLICDFDIVL